LNDGRFNELLINPLISNLFDLLFRSSNFRSGGTPGGVDVSNSVSVIHSHFVRGVFSQATKDVALVVDQSALDSVSIVGGGGGGMQQQHVFCRIMVDRTIGLRWNLWFRFVRIRGLGEQL
jgi:hypothetical protein